MRRIVSIGLFIISVAFSACNQPAPTQSSFSGKVILDGYGETIDSSYYKVWSDSSWEEFYGDTSINGTTYTILLSSDSSEYIYDSSGNYFGFKLPHIYGENIIVFDSALASLPDTLIGNLTYVLQTTFSFQGAQYGLIDNETLVDSGTVGTPFGIFTNCPGIQSSQVIVTGGSVIAGSNVVYWLAKGPSVIEQDFYDSFYGYYLYSITMSYGVVNGQTWNVGLSKSQLIHSGKVASLQNSISVNKKSLPDIRSLASKILRGIRRGPLGLNKRWFGK